MSPTRATRRLKEWSDALKPSRSCHDLPRFETRGTYRWLPVPYAQKYKSHPTKHMSRSELVGHSYKYQENRP